MKTKFLAIGAFTLIAVVVALFFVLRSSDREALEQEKEEFARLQREAMQEELAMLSDEYENQFNKLTVGRGEATFVMSNDSLIHQLRSERAKVDRLMEELTQVKTTSAARIAELTKEVGSLRRVLKTYVVQIDSLHTANERLRAENKQVHESYTRATNEVRQLASEKTELTNRVSLAAKLDATAITITPLDKRGKPTKRIGRIENIQIAFRVAKNITAEVGPKLFYTRIMSPSDEVMVKGEAGTFLFEGRNIPYSTRREVEYSGEEMPVVMYWPVEEALLSGTYRVMIFADGNLIGSSSFAL